MTDSTVLELLHSLSSGEITSESLLESYLQTIQQREPELHAFLAVDEDGARQSAQSIDARRKKGEKLGALAGIPIALKDLLCVQGWKTTCASRILESFRPPYDAHVVTKLREADAILLGRTNMDEFAMGSSTENSGFQVTCNPHDIERIPGGSSGGSTVAVAAKEAPLALGTDTGGSIRQPSGFCGVVGMKPTYGRVSRFGLVAFASSLDQIGPIANSVKDAALLLEVIAGHDRRDSTSVDQEVPGDLKAIDEPIENLTLGVPREYFNEGLDAEVEKAVRDAIQVYKDLGATIKEIDLPHAHLGVATYYLVATAEASGNLARYDGVHYGHRAESFDDLIHMVSRSRGQGFGDEVKRRIMLGTFALSSGYIDAYYLKALKVRRLIKNDYDAAFETCDAILGPTSPTLPFKIGERVDDPLSMYLADIYTIGANLAGLPAMSVPCGWSKEKLPIGLQIQAAPFQEEKLFRIAQMFERA